MKIVAMIPIKLNNERTPGKNTKTFFDGTPLMYFVQKNLLSINAIEKIYVYCSDDDVQKYILDGVKYLKRPDYLDLPTSNFNEFFNCFHEAVEADIYVSAFATAPFIEKEHYEECIDAVKSGRYDSAFTATKVQEFMWNEHGKPVNFDPCDLPRTQDLPALYAETGGLYVFSIETYDTLGRRIGNNPYITLLDSIEAFDIDYPEDFEIANAIYKEILFKKWSTRYEASL
jgi:CMP-N-acetylneuraminic acid synthetase